MCLDVRARMPPSVTATAGPAVHGGFPLGEGRVVSKGGALSGGDVVGALASRLRRVRGPVSYTCLFLTAALSRCASHAVEFASLTGTRRFS